MSSSMPTHSDWEKNSPVIGHEDVRVTFTQRTITLYLTDANVRLILCRDSATAGSEPSTQTQDAQSHQVESNVTRSRAFYLLGRLDSDGWTLNHVFVMRGDDESDVLHNSNRRVRQVMRWHSLSITAFRNGSTQLDSSRAEAEARAAAISWTDDLERSLTRRTGPPDAGSPDADPSNIVNAAPTDSIGATESSDDMTEDPPTWAEATRVPDDELFNTIADQNGRLDNPQVVQEWPIPRETRWLYSFNQPNTMSSAQAFLTLRAHLNDDRTAETIRQTLIAWEWIDQRQQIGRNGEALPIAEQISENDNLPVTSLAVIYALVFYNELKDVYIRHKQLSEAYVKIRNECRDLRLTMWREGLLMNRDHLEGDLWEATRSYRKIQSAHELLRVCARTSSLTGVDWEGVEQRILHEELNQQGMNREHDQYLAGFYNRLTDKVATLQGNDADLVAIILLTRFQPAEPVWQFHETYQATSLALFAACENKLRLPRRLEHIGVNPTDAPPSPGSPPEYEANIPLSDALRMVID